MTTAKMTTAKMTTPYSFEIQGHRGFGHLAPHNSEEAFYLAGIVQGVDSVEFDVRQTSDGVLVVSHGPEYTPPSEDDSPEQKKQKADQHDSKKVIEVEEYPWSIIGGLPIGLAWFRCGLDMKAISQNLEKISNFN
jgi:glycerophosphoryl diester phosphodiesterase